MGLIQQQGGMQSFCPAGAGEGCAAQATVGDVGGLLADTCVVRTSGGRRRFRADGPR